MGGRPKLMEVFKDFEIEIIGWSGYKRKAAFKILRRDDAREVTLEDLKEYVKKLQKRYPSKGFRLRKYKGFRVIDQRSYVVKDGKKRRVYTRVPIYFDLKNQRFYVPSSYVRRRSKLVNYICMVTLGALGVSQSIYQRMVR